MTRKIPKFRPLPVHTRGRVQSKEYARFYGNYITNTGKRKRASFQVNISGYRGKAKYLLIKNVCTRLLKREIPEHKQGQVFSSYDELMHRTHWFRVRRIERYKAGVRYG
jgi:hypothetical protein